MKTKFAILFLVTVISASSCKKLDISRINKITTGNIEISDSVITVQGTIVDISKNGISDYGHCWSAQPEYNVNDNKTTFGKATSKGQYNSILTNLNPNTVYYVRAYFSDGSEVKYGNEVSFNSSVAGISILTDIYQFINTSSVNVAGSISGIESVNILDFGHCWSTMTAPTINDSNTSYGILTDSRNFTSTIYGMSMMTSYFVRSYGKISDSVYVYGNTVEILIPDLIVQTNSFTLQGNSQALLEGNIVSIGIYPVTDYGHCWAVTTSTPSINNDRLSLGTATQTGNFNTTLINMETGVDYYYRAYAIFGNTVRYGTVKKIQN